VGFLAPIASFKKVPANILPRGGKGNKKIFDFSRFPQLGGQGADKWEGQKILNSPPGACQKF